MNEPKSIDEILLKHRSDAIAISRGESNGKDIGESVAEAKSDLKALIKEAEPKHYEPLFDDAKRRAHAAGYNEAIAQYATNLDKLFNVKEEQPS